MSSDEQFEALAQETLSKADKIPCSQEDYRAGLRSIIEELQVAIRASEETDPNV